MSEQFSYEKFIDKIFLQDYNKLKQTECFTDDIFPPNDTSIGLLSSSYQWSRISKICSEFYLVRIVKDENELIDDVVQGDLGDCYFLSALSALAERRRRVEKIFSDVQIHPSGIYRVTAFINGKPTDIILDDFFPVKGNKLAFSDMELQSKNIWPLLLEKAWAKVNLSYNNIVEGNISQAFEFLTPSPLEVHFHIFEDSDFDDKHKLYKIIKKADDEDSIICCDISNKSNLTSIGLLSNHAYSIISIHEIHTFLEHTQLLKIRNPWGSLEWNGDWSDSSEKWTPELKAEFNLDRAKDDGIFYMAFKDYCRFFTSTYICRYKLDFQYKWKEFTTNNTCMLINMKINMDFIENETGFITISQTNSKIYKSITQNKFFINEFISVYILDKTRKKFIGCTSGCSDRLSIKGDFAPGEYVIIVKFPNKTDNLLNFNQFLNITPSKDIFNEHMSPDITSKHKFVIGLYSAHSFESLSFDSIPENIDNINSLEILLYNLLIKFTDADSLENSANSQYFHNEGELNITRYMNFLSEKDSSGFLIYKNDSNAIITEKLILIKTENINFVLLGSGNKNSLYNEDKNLTFYEDTNEAILVEKIVNYENNNCLQEKSSENFELDSNLNLNIQICIPPYSYFVVLLEKSEESACLKYDSFVNLSYPVSYLWSEKKFLAQKQRIKYKENLIDIFESVIRHPTGVLFKYKNKTKEYKIEIKIKVENCENCRFNKKYENLYKELTSFGKANLEEFENDILDVDKELISKYFKIMLMPGECNFAEITADDIFKPFTVSTNIEYEIKLV